MFGFSCPATRSFVGTKNELFAPFPRFSLEVTFSIVGNLPRNKTPGSVIPLPPSKKCFIYRALNDRRGILMPTAFAPLSIVSVKKILWGWGITLPGV